MYIKTKMTNMLPSMILKSVTYKDNYVIFKLYPLSLKYSSCTLQVMIYYIYDFLGRLGTIHADRDTVEYLNHLIDGEKCIINMSLVNLDACDFSKINTTNEYDINIKKFYYVFKRNHLNVFTKLMLKHIFKKNNIEMNRLDIVYPKVLTIMVPVGSFEQRFNPSMYGLMHTIDLGTGKVTPYVVPRGDKRPWPNREKLYPWKK
uniref:Uncharacterized protein n=1 Tax=Fomitiporia mediterranea TaxID=208960 RepID=A0A5B9R9A9_9AGAM|nr:hypothetical protein Fomme_000054 [Fomitiporia mediterranea]QEG57051.1 hypothetical protein Fomme_000054 [Fomitiporia mediterranea]